MDAFKNFAKGIVSTGYDASAVSITLTAGHGARFPAAPFNATWWNASDYPDPSDDPNVEIVRVTNIATDTLTVIRAQEGISASTKNTAGKTYKLVAGLTAQSLNSDLRAKPTQGSLTGTTPAITLSEVDQELDWALTGNSTPTCSGYAAGRRAKIYITGDTVLRTFAWPSWTWIEGAPASCPANKHLEIQLDCRGATAANVFACYGAEQ